MIVWKSQAKDGQRERIAEITPRRIYAVFGLSHTALFRGGGTDPHWIGGGAYIFAWRKEEKTIPIQSCRTAPSAGVLPNDEKRRYHMPVMEISIVPIGTQSASVSEYVASALRVLQGEKGLTYALCPMGTVIEAPSLKRLLAVAEKMHKTVLRGKIQRVVTSINIDDRRDKRLTMRGKIQSVEKRLCGKTAPRF